MSLRKVAFGFAPTSITGCVLWMDAADSSTVTLSSSAITQWNDKSASANHFVQATTANSPTVGTSANGLSTIYFATTNQQLVSSQNSATSGNASRTVIQVFWCPTLSSAYYSVTGTESSGNPPTAWGHAKNPNADVTYPFMYSSVGDDVYTVVNSTPNPLITYAQFNSTDSSFSSYYATLGATNGTTTVGNFTNKTMTFNTTAGVWYLGRRQQAATGSVTSHLLEMIHFNKALSTIERQQVEGYLTQKWGLAAILSAGHPGLTTIVYRPDYIKNSVIVRNMVKPIPYFTTFSPRQISGLVVWLDGTDPAGNGVLPANGATVSTWVDKSGNANNGTSGTATFNRDSVGGFINFTGGQTYSITNPNVVVNQYFTIFVVEQLQNYAGGEAAFMGGNGSVNGNLHMRYTTGGGGMKFGFFANDLDASVTAFLTNSTQPVRIWSFSFLPSSRVIYLNGTSIGSDSNNTQLSGWGGAAIGAMVSYGGQYYNGKMREVMIFSGSLLTAQRQQIESYLAQKWGLTASLPGGHSHATQPAGAITRTALANLRLVIQPRRYTSFRWTITAGNTSEYIQFSEFQVGFNSTQLVFASPTTATTGSSISWNTPGEGPAQAVDNNINTKGLGIGTSGLVLIVTVATPIAANMYRWATANDVTPGRNPTQWTVDGSADNATYVRLHTQNTAYSTPSSTFTFTSWIPFTYR